MERFRRVMRQTGVQTLLFGLFLALLSGPFLAARLSQGLGHAVVYLLGVWAALILVLFALQAALGGRSRPGEAGDDDD